MLRRVERHIITKTDKNYEAIKEICHKSKNLYNYANYILRKSFFETNKLPNEYDLVKILTNENQNDYRALPAQTAQQTIKLLFKNWKSFFKLCKTYKKDKSKFKGRPRIPKGRGSRQMCRMDQFGFPRTSAKASKSVKGFQTGDIVKAIVPKGSKQGEYLGKVAVRSSGKFDIRTKTKIIQGVGFKYCNIIQRCDGYSYSYNERKININKRIKDEI